jgi:carbamoyltransferase
MTRWVLGINAYLHDSAVALLRDGELVFAVAEERLSRVKKDSRFPTKSITAALEHGGIEYNDLDAIAFGWNRPGRTPLHTLQCSLTGRLPLSMSYVGHSLLTVGRELRSQNGALQLGRTFGQPRTKPLHIDHHRAHAWSAYGLSGFDESTVVVMDGRGATQATSVYHAEGDRLRLIRTIKFPNSLGAFYEAFTDLLGFERNNDEWKVMGLAAYGEPTHDLSDLIHIGDHGYRINSHAIHGKTWGDLRPMIQRFGPRRDPESVITDEDRNLAASAQHAVERAIFALIQWAVETTGSRNLCLAGGVAMNSKANGRLLSSGIVDDLFVQPAATDDGTAIGAAIGAHESLGLPVPRARLQDVYLGPAVSTAEVERTISTYKLKATRVRNVEAVAARLVAEGNIIGWYQGRMEFGPRALGNRSIIADARNPEMKDRVNEIVKFREGWRPFAPSCLEESAADYFAGCREAPYMILTFDVLPEARHRIPAVTHVDNTARVQTVSQDSNPRYWKLISEFSRLTGVPVVMNTSFNLRGEPIVCTPKDAIRTFYSSGLDFLVLDDYILPKDQSWRIATESVATLEAVSDSTT